MKPFRAGDLIFVRGDSPLSWLIRYIDGQFSHVCIALSDRMVLEAKYWVNVRIAPMTYSDYEVVNLNLTPEQRDEIVHAGIEYVGKRYDYSQLIWEGIMYLFRIKGKNRFNHPNKLICSEILIQLLLEINWFEDSSDIEFIMDKTPNELYRIILEQTKAEKISS